VVVGAGAGVVDAVLVPLEHALIAAAADHRGTRALNVGGTLTLHEAVKASGLTPRVVVVGTGICYGNPGPEHLPVREDCPLRPNNPYAASKAAADLLGIQHFLGHGTDVVIARPFNHAGPRQSSTYVLSALARQVAEDLLSLAFDVQVAFVKGRCEQSELLPVAIPSGDGCLLPAQP